MRVMFLHVTNRPALHSSRLTQHLAHCADVRYCTMSELGSGRGAIGGRVNKPEGWQPRGLVHARPHTFTGALAQHVNRAYFRGRACLSADRSGGMDEP